MLPFERLFAEPLIPVNWLFPGSKVIGVQYRGFVHRLCKARSKSTLTRASRTIDADDRGGFTFRQSLDCLGKFRETLGGHALIIRLHPVQPSRGKRFVEASD
jgi:hypothetical protein